MKIVKKIRNVAFFLVYGSRNLNQFNKEPQLNTFFSNSNNDYAFLRFVSKAIFVEFDTVLGQW